MVRGAVLEANIAWRLEQHVEDGTFGRREQHGVDERLAFATTAVSADVA